MMVDANSAWRQLKYKLSKKLHTPKRWMSASKVLVEPDADTDEAPVGEDVNCWHESDPAVALLQNPSLDRHPLRPKEPTSTSPIDGRTTQADERFVPTTPMKE